MSARGRVWPGSCDGVSENEEGGLSTAEGANVFFLGGEREQGSGDRSDLDERRIGDVAPGRRGGFFFFLGFAGRTPAWDGSE